MATVSEAIGLALPYSAGAPAPYEIRDRFCMAAGEKIMDLLARGNPAPRYRYTQGARKRSDCWSRHRAGRQTRLLHLPAIANECGIDFDLFDVAEIFKKTPYIADLKPGGKYVAKDMFEAGGIPLADEDAARSRVHAWRVYDGHRADDGGKPRRTFDWNDKQDVVYPADNPITPTGGVVGLKGNLAPGWCNRQSGWAWKNSDVHRSCALF